MHTIGQVAKKFSISRSTLLYYDSIGLLSPSGRSNANYRLYSDSDILKMEKISQFRETGLSLESIANILEKDDNIICAALENRLFKINEDIQNLRYQQNVIVQLLKNNSVTKNTRIMTKEKWVSLLNATGLNDSDMEKWHVEFEKFHPKPTKIFLSHLEFKKKKLNQYANWRVIAKVKSNRDRELLK